MFELDSYPTVFPTVQRQVGSTTGNTEAGRQCSAAMHRPESTLKESSACVNHPLTLADRFAECYLGDMPALNDSANDA